MTLYHSSMQSVTIGVTELNVHTLSRMRAFYETLVGLHVLKEQSDEVTLGHGKTPILRLISATVPPPHFGSAGLYHNAILFASRGDLARTVQTIIKNAPESVVGTADHLVSDAFYFEDPEGNGLELYYDKDPTTWQWENDHVKMASLFIDPHGYIDQYANLHDTTQRHMGHVHLKVGSIDEARRFYSDILGFDVTAELPGALFVSRNRYHHHLGLNTWESAGADKRVPSLGLRSFQILLSETADLSAITSRVQTADLPFQETAAGISLLDPWNNQLHIALS